MVLEKFVVGAKALVVMIAMYAIAILLLWEMAPIHFLNDQGITRSLALSEFWRATEASSRLCPDQFICSLQQRMQSFYVPEPIVGYIIVRFWVSISILFAFSWFFFRNMQFYIASGRFEWKLYLVSLNMLFYVGCGIIVVGGAL